MMSKAGIKWLLQMAWRDSQRNQGRLLLFISSIILGISALVAINSFSENLQKDINKEAKNLLGADLKLESNRPPSDSLLDIYAQIGDARTSQTSFMSMALFPKNGGTRLSNINAIGKGYPYYGNFETTPTKALSKIHAGKYALVDRSLMMQYGVEVGDSVRVGNLLFEIVASLNAVPGRSGITGAVAPAIYIDESYLTETGLIQEGSRIDYEYYFKLSPLVEAQIIVDSLQTILSSNSIRATTVEDRKESIGQAFGNLATFLNLVGFIALLLGCIGVASAVHIYVKHKLSTVALLRCLGASGRQAFMIFMIQIAVLGLLGALVGAGIGSLLQLALPKVLEGFLPIANVSTDISLSSVLGGIITGLSIALLFAILPLLAIRKTSPLRTLNAAYQEEEGQSDPIRWVIYILIFLFVAGFTYWQTHDIMTAFAFPVAIGIAFSILSTIAKLVMYLVKRFFPTQWSYIFRQGIANLYRPNNQTLILIVSIGLGVSLISTLFFLQGLLLNQLEFSASGEQPNMIMYNIQPTQKEDVIAMVDSFEMPVIQQVPIVTIRLETLEGRNKAEVQADSNSVVKRWVFNREYRVTYRDSLTNSEKIIEGVWQGEHLAGDIIPISISDNIAEDMNVKVGSQLSFNVQGAILKTQVSSIREIDWGQFQTNFFVLFPKGVLEKAPQFSVVVSRTADLKQSASFQQALIQKFPNISIVDLSSILDTVESILAKVSFVIRFMALFSILTGLLVLVSSVVLSKYQRIKESVLLRTLGAKSKQILQINLLEYLMLGSLATLTGIGLAGIGTWILAKFVFEIPFKPDFSAPFLVFISITTLTVLIGMLNSREIIRKSPLEVLREQ